MRIKHEYLRQLRLGRGWTQHEVAQELEVDIRTYRKYETGEINGAAGEPLRASQFEMLRGLAALYSLDGPEDLLQPEPEPPPAAPGLSRQPAPTTGLYDPIGYVHRAFEEARALRRLRRAGAPVVLQAPERFGSTTLLSYLLHAAVAEQSRQGRMLRVNMSRLVPYAVEAGKPLLLAFGEQLLRGMFREREDFAERARTLWEIPGTEKGKLSWLMEQNVLSVSDRVLLAIEHADALLGHPGCDAFFALLRSWSEASTRAPWARLRLMVTISVEPAVLERSDHSSFFALAPPIHLEEFERPQLAELGALFGITDRESLDRLTYWIGGIPFLARLAFQEANERDAPLVQLLETQESTLALFKQSLRHIRRALELRRDLLPAISDLMLGRRPQLRLDDYCFLFRKGVIAEKSPDEYRIRCRLYEELFRILSSNGHSAAPVANLASEPSSCPG
ncbi:MAG: AAA-like domain-containing protein [Polyangia bacterium]